MKASKKIITDSLTEVMDKLSRQYSSDNPTIYLGGDASLFLQGIKSSFDDIEWILPVLYPSTGRPEIRLGDKPPLSFNLNLEHGHVIPVETLHGAPRIFKCLSPSTVFLSKLESSKENDLITLEVVSSHTDATDIIRAINACTHLNSEDALVNMAKLALSEIACFYYWGTPNLTSKLSALVDLLEMEEHLIKEIRYSFGLDLDVPYDHKSDEWSSVLLDGEQHLAAS